MTMVGCVDEPPEVGAVVFMNGIVAFVATGAVASTDEMKLLGRLSDVVIGGSPLETGYEGSGEAEPVVGGVVSGWTYVVPSIMSWVTGQIVVYKETTSVVTFPVGQSVTVGAHDVTVTIFVENTVDRVVVVILLLDVYELGGKSRIGLVGLKPVLFLVLFADGIARVELKEEAT